MSKRVTDDQTVIANFLTFMDEHKLTQRQAAARVGCADTTLNQILAGKYSGKVRKWLDKMQEVMDRQKRADLAPHTPGFVMTSVAQSVLNALDLAHAEQRIVFVQGQTGVGKTFAAREYVARYPETILITGFPGISQRNLVVSLHRELKVLWDGNAGLMLERCAETLQGTGRLLIIDEADFFTGRALHSVRYLYDRSGCGVAILGTPAFIPRLEKHADGTEGQLLGRIARAELAESISEDDAVMIAEKMGVNSSLALAAYHGWPKTGIQGCLGQARRLVYGLIGALRNAEGKAVKEDHVRDAFDHLMRTDAFK